MKKVRFLGLDVHADTIAVAVAEPDGEVRSLGIIPHREESVRKLIKKLGPREQLQACYEAGPTGHVLYWQLTSLGVKCEVVAPTLVPVKPGDRVKTDRRDARKLAPALPRYWQFWQRQSCTAVWARLVRLRGDLGADVHGHFGPLKRSGARPLLFRSLLELGQDWLYFCKCGRISLRQIRCDLIAGCEGITKQVAECGILRAAHNLLRLIKKLF